jgi:predicted Rossmann fold nucleotide-binding protein DprA/Smf involved in DNA uptake
VILDTYDLARELRDASVTVIGGFHSPMEKECLDLLLRGTQPVIICPARSIDRMRIPKPWKGPLAEGRLLVISPFVEHRPRVTLELAEERNRFVAHLADEIFIAHAAAGSKTLTFCEELLNRKKPVMTIDRAENSALLKMGVTPLAVSDAQRWAKATNGCRRWGISHAPKQD